jgi:hypothetical protein
MGEMPVVGLVRALAAKYPCAPEHRPKARLPKPSR